MSSRRVLLLAMLFLVPAAVPAGASATASVCLDRPCYQDNGTTTKATFYAEGLTPGSVVPVTVDGQVIGQVKVGATGTVANSFAVPAHTQAGAESTHELALAPAGGEPVRTTFLATSVTADFSPSQGDPAVMKVRFTAAGMNLVAAKSAVYLHYVSPKGKLRRTVLLGRATGACGHLRTGLRRLFGFRPSHGNWTLQVDTSRRYRRGTAKAGYPWARIGVRVRAAAR